MRLYQAIAAAIVLAATSAVAQGNHQRSSQVAPPPIYVKRTEVNVLVTNGEGHQEELALGYNILGAQHPMSCIRDAGCLVTIASMVGISDVTGGWSICTLVDGVATHPPCPRRGPPLTKEGDVGSGLASVLLTKGQHTIETGVVLRDSAGARLGIWEVHYTLLLDPPHGHDK